MNITQIPYGVLHDLAELHYNPYNGAWTVRIESQDSYEWAGEWGYYNSKAEAAAWLSEHTDAAALRERTNERAVRMGWEIQTFKHGTTGTWDAVVTDSRTKRRKALALSQPTAGQAADLALHWAITNPMV